MSNPSPTLEAAAVMASLAAATPAPHPTHRRPLRRSSRGEIEGEEESKGAEPGDMLAPPQPFMPMPATPGFPHFTPVLAPPSSSSFSSFGPSEGSAFNSPVRRPRATVASYHQQQQQELEPSSSSLSASASASASPNRPQRKRVMTERAKAALVLDETLGAAGVGGLLGGGVQEEDDNSEDGGGKGKGKGKGKGSKAQKGGGRVGAAERAKKGKGRGKRGGMIIVLPYPAASLKREGREGQKGGSSSSSGGGGGGGKKTAGAAAAAAEAAGVKVGMNRHGKPLQRRNWSAEEDAQLTRLVRSFRVWVVGAGSVGWVGGYAGAGCV
jgi:hypothetical protein